MRCSWVTNLSKYGAIYYYNQRIYRIYRIEYASYLTSPKHLFSNIHWDLATMRKKNLYLTFLFSDHAICLKFLKDVGWPRTQITQTTAIVFRLVKFWAVSYSLTLLIKLLLNLNYEFRHSCYITTTPSSTNAQTIVCYSITSVTSYSHLLSSRKARCRGWLRLSPPYLAH